MGRGREIKSRENMKIMVGTIMSQIQKSDKHAHISVNKGIKRHGEKAINSLLLEFGQLHK